jgi:hypothetical protein
MSALIGFLVAACLSAADLQSTHGILPRRRAFSIKEKAGGRRGRRPPAISGHSVSLVTPRSLCVSQAYPQGRAA